MPLNLSNSPASLRLGNNAITSAFLGTTPIFPSWSPAALFASGEQGAWYDPSDFSSMFQDLAGTLPVTAAGQSVGLQLDRRSKNYSNAFNGNSWLSYSPSSLSLTDANSYTVECWFRIPAWNDNVGIFGWRGGFGLAAYGNTLKFWGVAPGTQIIDVIGTSEISALVETWVHFALVYNKSNNTKTIYINGTAKHTSAGGLSLSSASALDIGRYSWDGTSGKNLNGSVSNFRILNGAAAYVANFTPPSASLEAVAGTVILTCGRYSANNPSVTQSGSVSVAGLNPFPGAVGNHATQPTAAAQPVLQIDGNGKHYLRFDGVDDFLVTPTITPGTDKVQVFAGVRSLTGGAYGALLEMSSNADTSPGTVLMSGNGNLSTYRVAFNSRGTSTGSALANSAAFNPPVTLVQSGLGDISGDSAILRINGAQSASSTADQGTGNYLAYPLYIGRRGGASSPFNGHLYGLIVRFGPNMVADQIVQTETWVNTKTGAY